MDLPDRFPGIVRIYWYFARLDLRDNRYYRYSSIPQPCSLAFDPVDVVDTIYNLRYRLACLVRVGHLAVMHSPQYVIVSLKFHQRNRSPAARIWFSVQMHTFRFNSRLRARPCPRGIDDVMSRSSYRVIVSSVPSSPWRYSRVVGKRRLQMLGQPLEVVAELLELAVGHRHVVHVAST